MIDHTGPPPRRRICPTTGTRVPEPAPFVPPPDVAWANKAAVVLIPESGEGPKLVAVMVSCDAVPVPILVGQATRDGVNSLIAALVAARDEAWPKEGKPT